MTDRKDQVTGLQTRLHANGLVLLGSIVEGGRTRVMVGNAGSRMVPHVPGLPEADPRDDPVNRWTRQVMEPIAEEFGATVSYPFDGPPWHPFVSWMLATGQAFISPLGLAVHPRYGLWFALRAALLSGLVLGLALGMKTSAAAFSIIPLAGLGLMWRVHGRPLPAALFAGVDEVAHTGQLGQLCSGDLHVVDVGILAAQALGQLP